MGEKLDCEEAMGVTELKRRLEHGATGPRGLVEKKTEAEETAEEARTATGALLNVGLGFASVVCGPSIQPVLLVVNGFVAAEVGKAWLTMMGELNPPNIISSLLRAM